MRSVKFAIVLTVLAGNLAALLLLTWIVFRKSSHPHVSPQVIGIELGRHDVQNGILLREWAKDGGNTATNIAGSECRVAQGNAPSGRWYMYFAVDPSFKRTELMDVLMCVEYFDHAPGEFRLNYDAVDTVKNRNDPYRTAEHREQCLGSQQWRKAYFIADRARFKNSQNGASDFRLDLRIPELFVRRVTIRHLEDPNLSTQN
jgi:hypothetical protein